MNETSIPEDGLPLSVATEPQSIPAFSRKWKVADATTWSWIAQGHLIATKIGPNVTRILPEHERAWLSKAKQSQPKNTN